MKPDLPTIAAIEYGDFTLHIDHFLKHDYCEVSAAATELPSIIEWLNTLLQDYITLEMIENRRVKQAEAVVYFELRGTTEADGTFRQKFGEKMTEKALELAVELDDRIRQAVEAHAEAKGWVSRLRTQISVLTSKLELVRTVEATRRHLDQAVSIPEKRR